MFFGCDIDEVVDALVSAELELQEQAEKKRNSHYDKSTKEWEWDEDY